MSQDCVATIGSGVQIRASSIPGGGNGLWTARLFHKHALITEYHGPIVDHKKALKLRKQNKHSHIRVLNSQFQYIDGIRQPQSGVGGASFANDARDSQKNNAIFICKHDHKLGRDRVYLKATQELPPNTEVFVGYGRDYWRNSKKAPASPSKQQASDSEQQQEESPQQPDQLHKRTRYGGRHQQQQQQQPMAQHNQQQPQPLQELRVRVNSSQNAAAIMQLRPQDQQQQAAVQRSRRCSPRLKQRHLQQHQQQVVAAAADAWQAGQPGFNIQQHPVAATAQEAALRMYLQQQQQQAAAGWPVAVGLGQGPYPLLSCSNLPMMSIMPFGCLPAYVQQPAAGYAGVPQLQQQPAQPPQQAAKRATRASEAAQAAAAAKAAAAAAMVEPWQVAAALAVPMLQQHKGQHKTRQGSFDSDEAADTTVAMDSCPEQQREEDGEEEEDVVQQSPAAAATSPEGGGSSDGRRQLKRSCVSIYRAVVAQDLSPGASTNPYKRVYRNRRAHT